MAFCFTRICREGPTHPGRMLMAHGLDYMVQISLANLYKSIMESIAFEYLSYSKIFSSQGIDIKSLTIIGGGSKSDMWNQMKADVLNTDCKTLKRSDGAALANAALAAYGAGDISDLD